LYLTLTKVSFDWRTFTVLFAVGFSIKIFQSWCEGGSDEKIIELDYRIPIHQTYSVFLLKEKNILALEELTKVRSLFTLFQFSCVDNLLT